MLKLRQIKLNSKQISVLENTEYINLTDLKYSTVCSPLGHKSLTPLKKIVKHRIKSQQSIGNREHSS